MHTDVDTVVYSPQAEKETAMLVCIRRIFSTFWNSTPGITTVRSIRRLLDALCPSAFSALPQVAKDTLKEFELRDTSEPGCQIHWELFLKDFSAFVGHELGVVQGMPPLES
jgi:hypothetical protein